MSVDPDYCTGAHAAHTTDYTRLAAVSGIGQVVIHLAFEVTSVCKYIASTAPKVTSLQSLEHLLCRIEEDIGVRFLEDTVVNKHQNISDVVQGQFTYYFTHSIGLSLTADERRKQ
jgi:hypothetical protein